MNINLNFTENKYKQLANNLAKESHEFLTSFSHNNEEALIMCLKGLDYEDINNYCELLSFNLKMDTLTPFDCYSAIMNNNIPVELKKILIETAYECIDNTENNSLGTKKTKDGKFITSSWLSHSLQEAKLAKQLAELVNLNSDIAFQMGLLHDIGRKKTHDFSHTIKGFELLIDEGWLKESLCCLTHSFLIDFTSKTFTGGRFANCDTANDGFYCDETLKAHYDQLDEIDDMTEFLNLYSYTLYDVILNISDLMATNKEITSPVERIKDIATRKKPDSRNRNYMLNNFINAINYYMLCIDNKIDEFQIIKIQNLEETEKKFEEISNIFFEKYTLYLKKKTSKRKILTNK